MFGPSLFGSLYAAEASRQAASSATSARRSATKADEVRRELRILTDRFDKLVLINMAMWSLMQERTGLSEDDLIQRVQDIDLRDGVPDGKITRGVRKCSNCGRAVSQRHNKCLFCGNDALGDTPFENV